MLEEAIRAAATPLTVPGQEPWQVISPMHVEAIARDQGLPRREVEIAALGVEVVPLHYMRNLARFGMPGQIDLLRTRVTMVGWGVPIRKCLQILAVYGVGRLRVLVPGSAPERPEIPRRHEGTERHGGRHQTMEVRPEFTGCPDRAETARSLAAAAANLNASLETSSDVLDLRRGDPAPLLGEPDVVVACLEEMTDEMLLQAVCRRRKMPLVVAGLQGNRAQVATILPGDPGVALIYQEEHPHLDRSRPGSLTEQRRAAGGRLVGMPSAVGTWLAEQVIALRLDLSDLLQHCLLYADMESGEPRIFPLGS